MHSVDVGVGRDDDLVVAQALEVLLDAERAHDVVELLVLVHRLAAEAVGVERLAFQRVDGLGLDVPRLDHGAARRVALGDEDRGLLAPFGLRLGEVELAVDELGDADRDLLGALARLLLDRRQLLAHPLVVLDLGEQLLGLLGVAMQPQHDLLADRADDPRADLGGAELVLGLRLEDGILDLDRHGADQAVADVLAGEAVLGVLVDALEDALAEGALVGAAVVGVLAVDEAVVGLAVGVGVGEGELEAVDLAVHGVVHRRLAAELVGEEVGEAVLRGVLLAVVVEGQAGVEEGVVAQAVLEVLLAPLVVGEDLGVGDEADEGAVARLRVLARLLILHPALTEHGPLELAVTKADDLELGREGVDGLVADPVEADRELEHVVVVLAAGVDLRHALDELAQGNPPAVVPDRHLGPVAADLDALAVAHDVLIDGVVDDLLEHHVDAVGGVGAVADSADVHAGAEPDVLERIEGLDRLLVVDDVLGCRHFALITPLSRA